MVYQRRSACRLQRLQPCHLGENRDSTEQEVAPRALRVQHVPQADRRRQVPPARGRSALRVVLRAAPQPALPRLRRPYHRPRDPSSGRVLARAPLRLRSLQEGARGRRLHGTGRPPLLLGMLRRQVRGALRRLRQAHRRQGYHRPRRQVAP